MSEGDYISIKHWREDEKPRERLALHGAHTLSDAELLAIMIRTGSKGFSAIDAAKELLKRHGDLTGLSSCDVSQFKAVPGLGEAKAVTLAAAFELSRRIQSAPFRSKKQIRSPEDVANFYIPKLRGLNKEIFRTLLLNSANQVFRDVVVSEGILNSSVVHPREVFRTAITESAASIILMHNHPSGNCSPSPQDIEITKKLVRAGELIDIKVLDHLIIAGDDFTSFVQEGII